MAICLISLVELELNILEKSFPTVSNDYDVISVVGKYSLLVQLTMI